MKIYIATDLEGVTGVYKFRQTRETETPEFAAAIRLLMGDVAAVAAGLREAGATEILAMDGHGHGDNFVPEAMVSGVRYVTGYPRGCPYPGLDASCAGIVLLGYHAMNGTADGVLHHTQNSRAEARYWYDGVERGEIFQSAVVAGHFGVPVILVTGDEATCREACATLDAELPTVAKQCLARDAAILIAAEEKRPLLLDDVRRALAEIRRRKPLRPRFPLALSVRTIGPGGATPETPWFAERESEVRSGLEIVSGSAP